MNTADGVGHEELKEKNRTDQPQYQPPKQYENRWKSSLTQRTNHSLLYIRITTAAHWILLVYMSLNISRFSSYHNVIFIDCYVFANTASENTK